MRAKKILASVLSFALCTSAFTSVGAYAEGSMSAAEPENGVSSETAENTDAAPTVSQDTDPDPATAPEEEPPASVVTIRLGDVNGDNTINAIDASIVLSAYANKASGKPMELTAAQEVAADVTKDGKINSLDATSILCYYAYRATGGKFSIEEYLNDPDGADAAKNAATTTTTAPVEVTTTTTEAVTTADITTTEPVTTTTEAPVTTEATTTTTLAPAPLITTTTTTLAPAPLITTTTTTLAPAPLITTTTTTLAPAPLITTTTTTLAPAPLITTTTTAEAVSTTTTSAADPEKVQEIKLSKTEIALNVGEGDISMVTMLPPTADKGEIWTSSDDTVAAVNFEGWITAKAEGECIIKVQSASTPEVSAEIKVKVTDPNKVSEIKLSKNEITVPIGGGDISMVTMLPEKAVNKEEIWVSSDDKIATVNDEGWIIGVAPGVCTVTVYSRSNPKVYASIKVTVTDPSQVSSIKLSKYEMDLLVGTMGISYVTMFPASAEDKSELWISSDSKIAKVDKWGNIYGVSAGTCIITVYSQSNTNVYASIKVTVHNRPVVVSQPVESSTTTTTATPVTTTTTTASESTETTSTSSEPETSTTSTTTTTTTTSTTITTLPATTTSAQHLIMTRDGATYVDGIIVVNKTYGLSKEFNAGGGLNVNALDQFNKLAEAASLEGLRIVCSSGYRSYENQEKIYNNYVAIDGMLKADTYSARAGHSEHQTGLAIDVNSISNDFADTPECAWLEKNAHKFGFIIRYPKGKEAITGFQYEPWHIRYLGVETATAVYNSGMCLEEYLGVTSQYN